MADYTLGGLTTRVQRRVRDTAFSSSEIHDFINDEQRSIFTKYSLRFTEKEISGALTVSSNEYALQSDHSTMLGVTLQHPTNTTDIEDISDYYLPYSDFFKRFPDREVASNARPQYWTEFGNNVVFDRNADLAYVAYFRYSKKPLTLSGASDIPELPEAYGELLVLGAAIRVFEQKDMEDKASYLQGRYDELEEAMLIREGYRQRATPMRVQSMRTAGTKMFRGS